MRRNALLIAAGLAVLVTSATALADETKKDAKFCAALTEFDSGVAALQAIGGNSTVGDLREASSRVESDAAKVVKTASKIKTETAKQFTEAAHQLNTDATKIPESLTLQQARSRIQGDVQNVKRAARQLATEAGCPQAAPEPKP